MHVTFPRSSPRSFPFYSFVVLLLPLFAFFSATPFIVRPYQLPPFAGKPVMISVPLNSSRCDLSTAGERGHRRSCAFARPPSPRLLASPPRFASSPRLLALPASPLPPDLPRPSQDALISSQDAARSRGPARSSAVRPRPN